METAAEGGRSGADVVRWAVEEIAWLLVASLPWILLAAAGWFRTGLLGLHATVAAYAAFRERTRLREWLLPRSRDLLFGLLGGVTILLLGGAYGLLLRLFGVELPDVAAQLRALVPSTWILLAWGACLVPLAEELLFRGRMLDALDRMAGPAWATAASSAAFMLVHGIPVAFPAYFVFGLIFVALRRRTGGLVAPIVAHALNNGVGLLFIAA